MAISILTGLLVCSCAENPKIPQENLLTEAIDITRSNTEILATIDRFSKEYVTFLCCTPYEREQHLILKFYVIRTEQGVNHPLRIGNSYKVATVNGMDILYLDYFTDLNEKLPKSKEVQKLLDKNWVYFDGPKACGDYYFAMFAFCSDNPDHFTSVDYEEFIDASIKSESERGKMFDERIFYPNCE